MPRRNWDRPSRRNERSEGSRPIRPTAREAFEMLKYLDDQEMAEGGNYVVVPGDWETMKDPELHQRLIAHRNRRCAENPSTFHRGAGDRWVRISNETFEMLGLRNCETCAAHIPRRG